MVVVMMMAVNFVIMIVVMITVVVVVVVVMMSRLDSGLGQSHRSLGGPRSNKSVPFPWTPQTRPVFGAAGG